MRLNTILFLLFSFLIIFTTTEIDLEKYGKITRTPTEGYVVIIFNSGSFPTNDDDYIYFKITAIKFDSSIDEVHYAFGDETHTNEGSQPIDYTKSITKSGKTTKYFKLKKSTTTIGATSGEFLTLTFYVEGTDNVIIENTKDDEASNLVIEYKVDLKKYGKVTVKGEGDDYIVFDSSGFKTNAEMYFKISAKKFIYPEVDYEFFDDPDTGTEYKHSEQDYVNKTGTETNSGIVTNFYTIKKDKKHLETFKGKYMTLYFYCEGDVTIENTKENESPKTGIIIAVVLVGAVIIGGLACYCYKKRLRAKQNQDQYNGGLQNNENEPESDMNVRGEDNNMQEPVQYNVKQGKQKKGNKNKQNQNQFNQNNQNTNQYNQNPNQFNQFPNQQNPNQFNQFQNQQNPNQFNQYNQNQQYPNQNNNQFNNEAPNVPYTSQ